MKQNDRLMTQELPPNPPCGGVVVTEGENAGKRYACEVHLLPWGHKRSDLGWLEGLVRPDTETEET